MNSTCKYDVVFYETFAEEELALRQCLPPNKKYYFTWKTIQESRHVHPLAPIVSIRTQSLIPLAWKDHIDALLTRSTGYDHIAAYFAAANVEIPAAHLPDYAGRAVAEQAMLLWVALIRKLYEQQKAVQTFSRDELTGRELLHKTVTIVGVGSIGSQVADIAKGLKMKVLGVDIAPNSSSDIEYVPLHEGISRADILVCALPLTDITHSMLNYELLQNLPAGALFVNIARGEIAPPEDLLHLLRKGILAGIGIDVYDCEKELADVLRNDVPLESITDLQKRNSVSATIELMEHHQVIATPHNAFNTEESLERKCRHTAQNIEHFFTKGEFLTPIIL